MMKTIFILVALLGAIASAEPSNSNPMAMYYYTQWAHWTRKFCGDEMINADQYKGMTHVAFAFQYPDASKNCEINTKDPEGDYTKIMSCVGRCGSAAGGHVACVKEIAKSRGIKAGISYGGWTLSTDFTSCAKDGMRTNLVNSVVKHVVSEDWDFLEFDWEYPQGGGNDDKGGVMHGSPDDWANFRSLITELRAALDKAGKSHVELGGAFGQNPKLLLGESPYVNATPMSFLCENLSYVGLMSYDLMGGWDSTTGWPAPLYADPAAPYAEANRLTIDWHVRQWKNACSSNFHKVILGLPSYGKGWRSVTPGPNNDGVYQQCTWTGPGQTREYPEMPCLGDGSVVPGTVEVWDVEVVYKNDSRCRHYYHTVSKQDYFYCPGQKYESPDVFFAYDGPEVMYEKMKYFKEMGGGGFMVWESSYGQLSGDGPVNNEAVNNARFAMVQKYRHLTGNYVWKPYEDAIWAGWNGQPVSGHTSTGTRVPDGPSSPIDAPTISPAHCVPVPPTPASTTTTTDAPTAATVTCPPSAPTTTTTDSPAATTVTCPPADPTTVPTAATTAAPSTGGRKCYGKVSGWYPQGCFDPDFCGELPGVTESSCTAKFSYWTESKDSCYVLLHDDYWLKYCNKR